MQFASDGDGTWLRWIIGGFAVMVSTIFGLVQRSLHKRIDSVKSDVAEVKEDVKDHAQRLSNNESDTAVLKSQTENASKERAEIKQSIDKLGGHIERLTEKVMYVIQRQ